MHFRFPRSCARTHAYARTTGEWELSHLPSPIPEYVNN